MAIPPNTFDPYGSTQPWLRLIAGEQDLFYIFRGNGWLWFRFCNKWGLSVKDTRKVRLLFSERTGLRGRRIGPYSVIFLK